VSKPLSITWQESDDAGFMSLRVATGSPEARNLVDSLMDELIVPAWPKDTRLGPKAQDKHKLALAVFMGELQRLAIRDRVGKHGMSDKAFVGGPFGRDVARRVVDALEAAGLLHVRNGWRWTQKSGIHGGKAIQTGSSVSSFSLTEAAHERLEAYGVTAGSLSEWRTHWARQESRVAVDGPLVELKASKAGEHQAVRKTGDYLPVNSENPKVAAFIAELEAHNEFMDRVGVEGMVFSGLKRVFNNGDQDDFNWQRGGRFASRAAGSYDSESKEDRLENLRIGGEPVAEIDIRASHPSILSALVGFPLDPEATDPYTVEGIPSRQLVKDIVTQAIGRGDLKAPRWSDKAVAAYRKANGGADLYADHPFPVYRSAVSAALPALGLLWGKNAVHEINFHESQIMTRAMRALRLQSIGSLPVHDCLIVPEKAEGAGKEALAGAFVDYLEEVTGEPLKVRPCLTVGKWGI
jgi:hypothetical protein